MMKKSDFQCRPPKTDVRFLIYTPKNIKLNIYLKKDTPKNMVLKEKYTFNLTFIYRNIQASLNCKKTKTKYSS